jgi:UDP-N-acetylglucosamine 2-epimerase (non-hydrolysing)
MRCWSKMLAAESDASVGVRRVERKAFVIMGTRPEAIKLAPVVAALRAAGAFEPVVVGTFQHRQMLEQALRPFAIEPEIDLDVMTGDQTPTRVAYEVMRRLEPLLHEQRPDWVVVQGDTTSMLAAVVASFYAGVRVAHVEAGLRSGRLDSPFPEEFNRRAAVAGVKLHLAPTARAARNLAAEGVPESSIEVVGNTVVDAVRAIRDGAPRSRRGAPDGAPLILATLHRRESFGDPLRRVLQALRRLAGDRPGRVRIVLPVHPNPAVTQQVRDVLGGASGVELVAPMEYPEFLALFARSRFAISDSGGVQEEGPSLGVPVLITREVTERPEVVESGWGKIVGTDEEVVVAEASRLLDDDAALEAMKRGANPFGDGHASERIARALAARI